MMKKAQGLPINVVIMTIIGIILFGMGLGIFFKFSAAGDKQVTDATKNVETIIGKQMCDNGLRICSPPQKAKLSETVQSKIYVTNYDSTTKTYQIELTGKRTGTSNTLAPGDTVSASEGTNCGTIKVVFPSTITKIQITGGDSIAIPLTTITNDVEKELCNFIIIATLYDITTTPRKEIARTPISLRIE
jgi:hypothetical protein